MKIHYVLKGTDENPCTRINILLRIVRVALVLWFLGWESHSAVLDAKLMRILIWESKFWKLKKQHVQALKSAKMKPAWQGGKPQKTNRKKKVKPPWHRGKLLVRFCSSLWTIFVHPPDKEGSLKKWILSIEARSLILLNGTQWSTRATTTKEPVLGGIQFSRNKGLSRWSASQWSTRATIRGRPVPTIIFY